MNTRTGATRREFLRSSLIAAAGLATGVSASTISSERTSSSESLRLVFATDIHLMQEDALRSEEGLAAALEAIKELQPRPDLIVCGGDLTDPSPNLDYPTADKLLDRFFGIWKPLHSIETHYVFGNHDRLAQRTRGFLDTIRGSVRGSLKSASVCQGCITLSKNRAGVL